MVVSFLGGKTQDRAGCCSFATISSIEHIFSLNYFAIFLQLQLCLCCKRLGFSGKVDTKEALFLKSWGRNFQAILEGSGK